MGRGNFCPCGNITFQWYINDANYYDGEFNEYYDYDLEAEDIHYALEKIKERFPSFYECRECKDSYWGQVVRLKNKLFEIGTADNQWSAAIYIKECDNLEENYGLAEKHFEEYKNGIKDILLDIFGEIYLRNGPWMSSKLTKEIDNEAAL